MAITRGIGGVRFGAQAALVVLGCMGISLIAGCSQRPLLVLQGNADSTYWRSFTDPATTPRHARVETAPSWGVPWFPHWRWKRRQVAEKLHPLLTKWIAANDTARTIEVLIGFRDTIAIERLNVEAALHPLGLLAADSMALANVPAKTMARRTAMYRLQDSLLRSRFAVTVVDSFWLSQCVLVRTTAGRVRAIADQPEVVSIVPRHIESVPPGCTSEDDPRPIHEAREYLRTDGYLGLGYGRGRLRLLDTGVHRDHSTFDGLSASSSPADLGPTLTLFDCHESTTCDGSDVEDVYSAHGTGDAAILVGRGWTTPPSDSRGVTDGAVDQYKIYWINDSNRIDLDAATLGRGLESHTTFPPAVVAIEVADPSGPDDQISIFANKAFAAGACVVAAIGNAGPKSTDPGPSGPQSPGQARWVLGVGARKTCDLTSGDVGHQSYGVVANRRKPDIQCPTHTTSAGQVRGETSVASETSGATPYAAAVALIMREWLGPLGAIVDPGQVYSTLIALGDTSREGASLAFPDSLGAGMVRLPNGGVGDFGADDLLTLSHRDHVIEIDDPSIRHVRAALWWPDPDPVSILGGDLTLHYDFDVELERVGGTEKAVSFGEDGVFERADYKATTTLTGTWRVRVQAKNTGASKQRVYWTFVATP